MNSDVIKYGLLIILLPVLQIGIFNNVNFLGYINPYIYIIFVFVFPFKKNKINLLVSSFILGLLIDLLTNDGGIHTFSIVFISYIRLISIQVIARKTDSDVEEIDIKDLSLPILAFWISMLTFIHHSLIFFLEQFSFNQFDNLLLKTFLSSLFSIVLIIFGLQLFLKKR